MNCRIGKGRKKIELVNRKFFGGDRNSQIGEGKVAKLNAQNPRNGFGDFRLTPGGEKNHRFMKIRFLTSKFLIKIKTKKAISSYFSRSTSDQDKIVCKHKMIKICGKITIKTRD